MNELNRVKKIQKELLSKPHFFQHLVSVMEEKNYLDAMQLQQLQMALMTLLSKQIEKFNRGQSSSIQRQKAEGLMASIYYTLGVYFRSLEDIDESIEILAKEKLEVLFEKGQKILYDKVEACKVLYEKVKTTQVATANIAYNDTIGEGIALFFKEEDEAFNAHKTVGDIDYPLCLDKMEEIGVLYMEGYLKKLFVENQVCSFFDKEGELDRLLYGYHEGYEHLLINIYEHVLLNGIGNILLGGDGIRLSSEDIGLLIRMLGRLEEKEMRLALYQAAKLLMISIGIENEFSKKYIFASVDKWLGRLCEEIKDQKVSEVFIIDREKTEKKIRLSIEEGKLEDEVFKKFTEEMRRCQTANEKMDMIRENITHIEDLKDVLEADCIFEEEFETIFRRLSDIELALLIRYSMMDEFASIDIEDELEEQKEWRKAFASYIKALDKAYREKLIAVAKEIEIY